MRKESKNQRLRGKRAIKKEARPIEVPVEDESIIDPTASQEVFAGDVNPALRRSVKVTVVFSADAYEAVMIEMTRRKVCGFPKATISGVIDDAISHLRKQPAPEDESTATG